MIPARLMTTQTPTQHIVIISIERLILTILSTLCDHTRVPLVLDGRVVPRSHNHNKDKDKENQPITDTMNIPGTSPMSVPEPQQ